MRVDGFDQTQVELVKQLEIAVDLLEHRIDDQGLAAAATGKDIAVGAGCLIEQLPEDHDVAPIIPAPQYCKRSERREPCDGMVLTRTSPYPSADTGADRIHTGMSWTVRSHIFRT